MKKFKFGLTILVLSFLAACGGGGGGSNYTAPVVVAPPPPPVLDTTFKSACGHNDAVSPVILPSFNLSTNDWGIFGKTLAYTPKNCVSGRNVAVDVAYAIFEWSFPQIGQSGLTEDIKSYLEIIYGHQLNGTASTNSHLPIAVSEITPTLGVNYDVNITQDGLSQTLFDVVFTSGRGNNILTTDIAVMVTKSPYSINPNDPSFVETVTIDGIVYDVLAHINQSPRFSIFFLPRTEKLTGTFKLKAFSDYLLSKKFLNSRDYLDGIEFGTEVISGTGKTEIKSYSITK